ncbi:MAG: helix-turn-helix domain-containing protein [Christensenellaceae bacterium]|jgi:repressor LexA|nr:helix-turn-helix domain-containing protein [Christensenellaceae bacterium]
MNRLKELRLAKGLTQDDIARVLGVQKAAVSKYEKGYVALPPDTLMTLCDFFGVTADHMLLRDAAPQSAAVTPLFKSAGPVSSLFTPITDTVGVPLVGRVHAGLPILADENITEYLPLPASDVRAGDYFYMEVEGDCMTGEFIPEGALVLVRLQNRVENGQIAVVRLENEVLLRKVKWMGNHLVLIPSNVKYEPIIITGGDVEIIGRVIEVRIRGL